MEQQEEKIKVFKDNAILEIKLGLNYYNRVNMVLVDLVKDKTDEQVANAIQQITNNNIKDEWVLHYETLIFFLRACQDYADANDLFEYLTPEEFRARTSANNPPEANPQ